MIDPVSSMLSYIMSRNNAAMAIAKSRMEAEAAMAKMLMEAAEEIARAANSSSSASPHIGSNIDIYV